MTSHLVAITGASGSGKTTLSQHLCQVLSSRAGVTVASISQDAYYRDYTHLSKKEREHINFDHPDSFDFAALAEDLSRLAAREVVSVPEYDYVAHRPLPAARQLPPADVVIVEGILLLHDPRVRSLFRLGIYLDVPLATCLERRLGRDVHERGRTPASVRRQFKENVKPMFDQYVYPQRQYAHRLLESGDAPEALANAIAGDIIACKR